jgi:4-amino-4-deoxy-L-arabinose transferase-like glycosyltransferase
LLILALAVRLAWGLSRPADEGSLAALPDQREYLALARNLIHGPGLAFLDSRFNDSVRAFRTPGYPLLIAACGANVRAVRVVQGLLDTSTVLAVFLLARLLVGGRVGPLLAAVVVAFNPYLIYFTGLILSETLFTAMLAWGMVLLAGSRSRTDRQSSLLWVLGGVVLGLSVLVRPSAVALPVLLGLLSVFLNPAMRPAYESDVRDRPRRRVPPGLAMVLLTTVCLLPWTIRNRLVLGRWIWLDTNSGFTLYDGYNADASGASDQSFVDRMPELAVLSEVQRDEYLSRKATEYAQDHPGRVWSLAWLKLGRTWSPFPLSEQFSRTELRLIAVAYSLPFDALVLISLIWGGLPRAAKAFLITPAVYFSIIHALTVGSLRYRIPAEPLLAVLIAGLAASGATSWRRTQLDGSAAVSADNSY